MITRREGESAGSFLHRWLNQRRAPARPMPDDATLRASLNADFRASGRPDYQRPDSTGWMRNNGD